MPKSSSTRAPANSVQHTRSWCHLDLVGLVDLRAVVGHVDLARLLARGIGTLDLAWRANVTRTLVPFRAREGDWIRGSSRRTQCALVHAAVATGADAAISGAAAAGAAPAPVTAQFFFSVDLIVEAFIVANSVVTPEATGAEAAISGAANGAAGAGTAPAPAGAQFFLSVD